MTKSRQTSVVILITLAELAWLAAFGLLFAYRGKVGEVGSLQRHVERIEAGAKDVPKLLGELDAARSEATNLQVRLKAFDQYLHGKTAEEAGRLLNVAAESENEINEARNQLKRAAEDLAKQTATIQKLESQLEATNKLLVDIKQKLDALPLNAADLADLYREASNKLTQARTQIESAGAHITGLSNRIGQLEQGEVAIRRELIGLPSANLQRVIFIVDTSSSMRNSPAWNEARSLMREWVEYLSVEECVLVNFNDKAVAFPPTGYQRLRDRSGALMAENKTALMAAFDNAKAGTYSDLLDGLKVAYGRPAPDLIVLFTDGHPHIATKTDGSYGGAILREVSKHPHIPILTVAVGSYEVEGAGGPTERRNAAITFLKQLASQTGGNFIGR
jgi:hypothetical protein